MAQYDRKDHYYKLAKQQGLASRAAFKLSELHKKFQLVRKGDRVLDLGCAPGGWLQPLADWVGPSGRVVGVDLRPVEIALPSYVTAIEHDIEALIETPETLLELLGRPADAIFSDIAPNTTGTKFQDQMRSLRLVQMTWECAQAVLKPGGHFIAKIFEGPDVAEFRKELRESFEKVSTVDPKATRKGSLERYFVCLRKKNWLIQRTSQRCGRRSGGLER